MLDTTILLTIVIGVMISSLLGYLFYLQRKHKLEEKQSNKGSDTLQLQAYERLTLLVDRIGIHNLINRTPHTGLTAREMQLILTKTIRDEFDYNVTQQIYVTPETWNAVKKLKEKNLLIINQVTSILPVSASALDFSKALMKYMMNDEKADLSAMVSEALSYEAKKLL